MVMHTKSEDRFLTEKTQELRRRARRNTFSLDEWGEQDILRGQLDKGIRLGPGYGADYGEDYGTKDFQPVPTGREVDRTYQWDRPIKGLEKDKVDIRKLDRK